MIFYSSHIVQTVTGFSHDALCDFPILHNHAKRGILKPVSKQRAAAVWLYFGENYSFFTKTTGTNTKAGFFPKEP